MSHQIWSNKKKNRLYLKISLLELERTEEFRENIMKEVVKLKKGFKCIGDFREFRADFELIPLDLAETYRSLMKQLIQAGMQEMVRIVNPEIYLVAKIIQEDMKLGVSIPYVYSDELAEVFLDRKE